MYRASKKQQQNTENTVHPTLIIFILLVFFVVNAALFGKYFDYVETQFTTTSKITSVAVLLWLIVSSLFASFHVSSFAFSLVDLIRGHSARRDYKTTPKVAALYLCKDDFNEKAFLSCLEQNYGNYRVYVLDDSSLTSEKHRLASICREHANSVSLIRRTNPCVGFKAGNINNALNELPTDVHYICLLDADEIIPSEFIRETVAICEANESLAFVQASHSQYGLSRFGKQIGESIDLHWKYFLSARNTRGFVYTFGHGVTFRLAAVKRVGGFPEVVAEDIAVSVELRQAGFRGYFAPDIICHEEAPSSYAAFRRRNRKITKGTLQFLSEFYVRFCRSNAVTATEKIDLLLASLTSLLPAAFFGFLFVVGSLTIFENLMQVVSSSSAQNFNSTIPMVQSEILILAFVTIFSPLIYLLPGAILSPYRTIAFVARSATLHLSLCFDSFRVAIEWMRTKRIEFHATGEKGARRKTGGDSCLDHRLGIVMLAFSVVLGSPFLAAAGLSLAMVPRMVERNLDGTVASVFIILPVALTIIGLLTVPGAAVAATGIFAGVALAHH